MLGLELDPGVEVVFRLAGVKVYHLLNTWLMLCREVFLSGQVVEWSSSQNGIVFVCI